MRILHAEASSKLAAIFFLLISISINANAENLYSGRNRSERSLPLLFTNTSAITFICGFGIPVNDLNLELVTVGMVFKAPQILPTTYQALKQQSSHPIDSRSASQHKNSPKGSYKIQQQDNTLSKYRIFFYKALEQLWKSLGGKGRTCVLKMICEVSIAPFHYKNGLLGELIHILFRPSRSQDSYAMSDDYDYIKAEEIGKNGSSCEEVFHGCHKSILELISNEFD